MFVRCMTKNIRVRNKGTLWIHFFKELSTVKSKAIHLTVTINNIAYALGTLRFNEDDIFYFVRDTTIVKKILNCDTGQMDFPREHLSWHSKFVHTAIQTEKSKKYYVDIINYNHAPLILDEPILTPLYVESIYCIDGLPLQLLSEFSTWKDSRLQNILTLDVSNGFSVIFILAPSSHDTPTILSNFIDSNTGAQLSNLIDKDHGAGRIQFWEKWDLVVITTPFLSTIRSVIPNELKSGFRLFNYQNVKSALADLMTQTVNVIG